MSVPNFLDCCDFVISLKLGSMSPPNFSLPYQDCYDILGPLHFCMNFNFVLSISAKKPAGIGQELYLIGKFGEYWHLNNNKSSHPKTWYVSSLIFSTIFCSFQNVSFAFLLLNLFLNIFFHYIVNRIIFKISFSYKYN